VLNGSLKIAKLILMRDLEDLRVIFGAPQCALPKGGTLKVDERASQPGRRRNEYVITPMVSDRA
jgi:hypothetical protein